jgi:hypothetical protein
VRKEAIETWYRSFKFEWLALVALEDSKRKALLARRASTRNEKHAKAQSLALYCCLLVTTTWPVFTSIIESLNGSILVLTGD